MTTYRPRRNIVQRHADGKLVNVARFRGNLFVCAQACCCGRTDMKNSPVPAALYESEWLKRRFRNYVHLTIGGCLGPCALANVAMLIFDSQTVWFHSMNDDDAVMVLFDYIEAMLDGGAFKEPDGVLSGHVFSASRWQPRFDGQEIEDHREWSGRERRPVATPACELSAADIAAVTALTADLDDGGDAAAEAISAISQMQGDAALPRKNGELVFAEPWQGRAFGMAVALHSQGAFEWEAFRQRLIARIREAEGSAEPFDYYRCWLAALEDILSATDLVTQAEAAERSWEFEFGERQEVF